MWVTVYCDASNKEGKSAGSYWIKSNMLVIQESVLLAAKDSHTAEFEIAKVAIERTVMAHANVTVTGILLVSDNQTVVIHYKYRAPKCKNPHLRGMQLKIEGLLKQHSIQIRTKHQKGHSREKTTGAYVNNFIDQKAKEKNKEQLNPQQRWDWD